MIKKSNAADTFLESRKHAGIAGMLLILLLLSCLFSLEIGAMSIPVSFQWQLLKEFFLSSTKSQADQVLKEVLLQIRLPRVGMSMLIGAGLSVCGVALQSLFRNPLADPSFIGISSGASLFAAAGILLAGCLPSGNFFYAWLEPYSLSFIAFAGAFISGSAVYALSQQKGQIQTSMILLAGISINALAGSLTGLLIFYADDERLRNITFWMLGSVGGATWPSLLALTPFVVLPCLLLPMKATELNLYALGEANARASGVNTQRLKKSVLLLTTACIGACVSVSGIIGFVGLAVPHVLRHVLGSDNRWLLPCSVVAGAALLTFADALARTLVVPAELPIGIITSLLGTPVLIWILLKLKKSFQPI
ncbi:MAG: iron ABC transporter permease [Cytophagaceae bacterium]|jgi:iron complex transport system permease protein|nr:iron ABC transporter permease [Cytophagaceae bacterium]